MSRAMRAALVGVFSLVAFAAAASAASAAVTLTSGVGNYIVTSIADQTLSAPTALGTITIRCAQRATLNVPTTGPFAAGSTVGSLVDVTFACPSGNTATVLARNIPIQLVSATATTLLARILNVPVSVAIPLGSCLFQGNIGFSVTNNTRLGNLLASTLSKVSGALCTGSGSVTATSYNIDRLFSYTGTA